MSLLPAKIIKAILDGIPEAADRLTGDEQADFDAQKDELQLREIKQNIYLRLVFSIAIFVLLLLWLGAVTTILFFCGFKVREFTLSDKVLITLLTTTTLNILTLFGIVAKYLFARG